MAKRCGQRIFGVDTLKGTKKTHFLETGVLKETLGDFLLKCQIYYLSFELLDTKIIPVEVNTWKCSLNLKWVFFIVVHKWTNLGIT